MHVLYWLARGASPLGAADVINVINVTVSVTAMSFMLPPRRYQCHLCDCQCDRNVICALRGYACYRQCEPQCDCNVIYVTASVTAMLFGDP